eukprot:553865-Amorphochlora_amoeboformis.AAC.1
MVSLDPGPVSVFPFLWQTILALRSIARYVYKLGTETFAKIPKFQVLVNGKVKAEAKLRGLLARQRPQASSPIEIDMSRGVGKGRPKGIGMGKGRPKG